MDNKQPPKQLNVEELNPSQSLETLWNLMNKAASKGIFNIDDGYIIKVCFSKLTNFINSQQTLQLQNNIKKITEATEDLKPNSD